MESTGVIIVVLEAKTGTSQHTGNPWTVQGFVIEVSEGDHGQYKRKQMFEVFGDDKIQQFHLQVGATVKVFFNLEAREHEGKWYNSTRVYAVEHLQVQPQQQYAQQQRPPQNGYFQPVQQGYPQPAPYYQQTQQGYPQQMAFGPQGGYASHGVSDDLPF